MASINPDLHNQLPSFEFTRFATGPISDKQGYHISTSYLSPQLELYGLKAKLTATLTTYFGKSWRSRKEVPKEQKLRFELHFLDTNGHPLRLETARELSNALAIYLANNTQQYEAHADPQRGTLHAEATYLQDPFACIRDFYAIIKAHEQAFLNGQKPLGDIPVAEPIELTEEPGTRNGDSARKHRFNRLDDRQIEQVISGAGQMIRQYFPLGESPTEEKWTAFKTELVALEGDEWKGLVYGKLDLILDAMERWFPIEPSPETGTMRSVTKLQYEQFEKDLRDALKTPNKKRGRGELS